MAKLLLIFLFAIFVFLATCICGLFYLNKVDVSTLEPDNRYFVWQPAGQNEGQLYTIISQAGFHIVGEHEWGWGLMAIAPKEKNLARLQAKLLASDNESDTAEKQSGKSDESGELMDSIKSLDIYYPLPIPVQFYGCSTIDSFANTPKL